MIVYRRNSLNSSARYTELWKFPVDVHILDDTLRTRFCHNFPLPPLMDREDAVTIMRGVSGMENLLVAPFHVQQLSMGSFFSDWIANFETIPRPKFVLYSNHDSTLRAVLTALGVFDEVWPPYASHIAMELWEETATGRHFVTMQYDGKNKVMRGCGGSEFCPFEDFARLLASFKTDLCDEPNGSLSLSLVT